MVISVVLVSTAHCKLQPLTLLQYWKADTHMLYTHHQISCEVPDCRVQYAIRTRNLEIVSYSQKFVLRAVK